MTLTKTGWYISTHQWIAGQWVIYMDFIHSDRDRKPEGAWWHAAGEEVNANVMY